MNASVSEAATLAELVRRVADGLHRLREAQVTRHACVRKLLSGGLTDADLKRLAAICEKAMSGILDEPVCPPTAGSTLA